MAGEKKKTTPRSTKRGGVSSATQPLDLYAEPPFVPYLLFNQSREKFHARIWDPACGRGTIVEEAIKAGYLTYATDFVDQGYNRFDEVRNFLASNEPHPEADIVCYLPNYKGLSVTELLKKAEKETYRKVALILPQDVLYGSKKLNGGTFPSSFELFKSFWMPKILYHVSNHHSLPPDNDKKNKPSGRSQDYFIIVWDKGFDGKIAGFEKPICLYDWLRVPDGLENYT